LYNCSLCGWKEDIFIVHEGWLCWGIVSSALITMNSLDVHVPWLFIVTYILSPITQSITYHSKIFGSSKLVLLSSLTIHNPSLFFFSWILHQNIHRLWAFIHWKEGYIFFIHLQVSYKTCHPQTRALQHHYTIVYV
jgi:hypothetical protein